MVICFEPNTLENNLGYQTFLDEGIFANIQFIWGGFVPSGGLLSNVIGIVRWNICVMPPVMVSNLFKLSAPLLPAKGTHVFLPHQVNGTAVGPAVRII